jgi:acyl-[acyl-carrier-protein]-phospholipid O-acyltransferase/long-chain-fatty-acid--[acyl-carrier-protein] ligase
VLHRIAWLLAKLLYRLRIRGLEHLPASGPALIVSNHVSYVDWLFLMAASPRPIRFVVARNFFSKPFVGWWLRRVRAIPLARRLGPKSLRETFHEVEAALKAGEFVCVFPEGYPTRNGNLLPFRRGFERIAQSTALPIIPIYLDQVWGSIFSYKHGKIFWKWSNRGRYPVSITFGEPLSNQTSAARVRQVVQELSAGASKERTRTCLPMHRQFVRTAARHPFRPCLIDNIGTIGDLTYGKALAGAILLARWLRPQVVGQPMVGLWMPASPGAALANIALALLGKTAVNLNYTAGQESVRSAIRQCGIQQVLTSRKFLDRVPLDPGPDVRLILGEDSRAQITNFSRARAFVWVVLLPGWLHDWILGLRGHKPSDLATVIFSSGSTGEPKGVALTYQNVTSNIEIFKDAVDFSPRDRVLGILPFFHSFGYTVTLWGALLASAVAVHHADPRAAREIGELCLTHRCTLMAATATFLRLYLRRCGPDDFKSMRLLVCGAEKLPPALIEEFHAKFGITALEGYGCTELSPVISVNIPDVSVNTLTQVGTKVGTVGQPLPGIAVRIVDAEQPESLAPLPIGKDGQVLVTGPNVMRGYLGRDDLNRKKLLSGWYVTGDIARVDDDGFITLTGRLEQFAKIGGEMVPLEHLDESLHKILGSADRMLAVTAVPDPKRGERIVVLYLPTLGMNIAELLKKLSEAGIPNLWIPDERDCFEVAEFPTLGSGKLNLRTVREMAVDLVNRKKSP